MAGRAPQAKSKTGRIPATNSANPSLRWVGAPWLLRLVNALIDTAVLIVLIAVIAAPFGIKPPQVNSNSGNALYGLYLAAVVAAYQVLTVRIFAKTFGMYSLRLKVISVPEGGVPSWTRSALRSTIFFLVPILIAIWPTSLVSFTVALPVFIALAALDKNRRALHDQWSGTMVIRAGDEGPGAARG